MRYFAWLNLVLMVLGVLVEPFFYGKPRAPYGKETWVASIIGLILFVPLCGRVLGWW
jgi:hypothetical protein